MRVRVNCPIYSSCHVQCFDSIHQGTFRVLASHSFPIIFNNTCVSWKEIATQMIAAGCRGYIGTLWGIKNKTALESARIFYKTFFDQNLIDVLFNMNESISEPADKNIYVFWGLHFESLAEPSYLTKQKVLKELVRSFFAWLEHIRNTSISEVRKNAKR